MSTHQERMEKSDMAFHPESRQREKCCQELKYFKTFDDLREAVLAAFRKYMKKLRSSADFQLLVDSFSGK